MEIIEEKMLNTKLMVQHQKKDLIFDGDWPPLIGGYYSIREHIQTLKKLDSNLREATIGETISIIHDTFISKENKYSNNIISMFHEPYGIYTFTGTLYVPNKGIYIQDNPQKDMLGNIYMNESELIKKLENSNSSVRFVPFGFKTGEMSPFELSKNPLIISLVGNEEGADKLAKIADKFKEKPYLPTPNNGTNPKYWMRVCRLSAYIKNKTLPPNSAPRYFYIDYRSSLDIRSSISFMIYKNN